MSYNYIFHTVRPSLTLSGGLHKLKLSLNVIANGVSLLFEVVDFGVVKTPIFHDIQKSTSHDLYVMSELGVLLLLGLKN